MSFVAQEPPLRNTRPMPHTRACRPRCVRVVQSRSARSRYLVGPELRVPFLKARHVSALDRRACCGNRSLGARNKQRAHDSGWECERASERATTWSTSMSCALTGGTRSGATSPLERAAASAAASSPYDCNIRRSGAIAASRQADRQSAPENPSVADSACVSKASHAPTPSLTPSRFL